MSGKEGYRGAPDLCKNCDNLGGPETNYGCFIRTSNGTVPRYLNQSEAVRDGVCLDGSQDGVRGTHSATDEEGIIFIPFDIPVIS